MRKPIYTSDLILKPEIKKILDEFILYPTNKVKPNTLIDLSIEYDKTLLGNAVEILFELIFDSSSNSFFHPLKSYEYCLLTALSGCKKDGYRNIDEYYIMPYNGILRQYSITTKDFLMSEEEPVKLKSLIDAFYKAIDVLSDKNCFKKNLDNSMLSILIISNIMPLCKRFKMFYSKYDNINPNTVNYLKKIYEQFPFEKIDLKKDIISEPPIYVGGTSGRPDFVVGDTLVEIKTTQAYLTKDHLRQIALYYLGLTETNRNRIEIEKVAIYYGLYGKMVTFRKGEIFNLKKSKSTLKKIETAFSS